MFICQNLEGFSWFLPFTNHSWRQKYMETMKILTNHGPNIYSFNPWTPLKSQPGWTLYDLIAPNLSSLPLKPRGRWRWCCLKWWDHNHPTDSNKLMQWSPSENSESKLGAAFLDWQQIKGQRNGSTWHKSKKDGTSLGVMMTIHEKSCSDPVGFFFWQNEKETKIHEGFFSEYNKLNKYIQIHVFQFVGLTSHFSNKKCHFVTTC